ncbi:MAG: DUF1214 domain-containing protein [Erythrobacter sp.]|nr:DUF1214 domain-containing protein [Erythrobacter sp.]
MRRGAIRYGGALGLGLLLGIGSALYLAGLWPGTKPLDFGDVDIGGWRSDFAIGSLAADPYTRARVARHGLLALAKSEAVYFTKATDDAGRPLTEECTYRLSGRAMPAQWWSITLYTAESLLPLNTDAALSIDQSSVGKAAAGWQAIVAPERPEAAEHWISSRNAGSFDLMLRLYVPDATLLADPQTVLEPPRIERLGCEGKGP